MLGVMEARLNKDDHGFLQVEQILIEKKLKLLKRIFFFKKIKNSIDFE
jgi:hypothetical protein